MVVECMSKSSMYINGLSFWIIKRNVETRSDILKSIHDFRVGSKILVVLGIGYWCNFIQSLVIDHNVPVLLSGTCIFLDMTQRMVMKNWGTDDALMKISWRSDENFQCRLNVAFKIEKSWNSKQSLVVSLLSSCEPWLDKNHFYWNNGPSD